MAFTVTPGVKIDATYVSSGVAPWTLGTTIRMNDGSTHMFVKASASALSTFAACVVSKSYVATMLTTGVARSSGNFIGYAQTSIATSGCGWVQLTGKPKVNCAANCAPYVNLYTTGTAGVLDDATVSGSGGLIVGVFAANTISNATAMTCVVNIPGFAIAVVGT